MSATLTVRLDEAVKSETEGILRDIGLNWSSAINIYAKAINREHKIPFELSDAKADAGPKDSSSSTLSESIARRIRKGAKVYQIESRHGALYLPDDFPSELEEAWGK